MIPMFKKIKNVTVVTVFKIFLITLAKSHVRFKLLLGKFEGTAKSRGWLSTVLNMEYSPVLLTPQRVTPHFVTAF